MRLGDEPHDVCGLSQLISRRVGFSNGTDRAATADQFPASVHRRRGDRGRCFCACHRSCGLGLLGLPRRGLAHIAVDDIAVDAGTPLRPLKARQRIVYVSIAPVARRLRTLIDCRTAQPIKGVNGNGVAVFGEIGRKFAA